MTSMQRRYDVMCLLGLWPPLGSPNSLNLGSPNILNLPTPMETAPNEHFGTISDKFWWLTAEFGGHKATFNRKNSTERERRSLLEERWCLYSLSIPTLTDSVYQNIAVITDALVAPVNSFTFCIDVTRWFSLYGQYWSLSFFNHFTRQPLRAVAIEKGRTNLGKEIEVH